MAHDEDLARVRQGVAAWNIWRAQNPEHAVNLREADLGGADLGGANLHTVNLGMANLQDVNLFRAILDAAMLAGADLRHANLFAANLHDANLYRANLAGANLGRANLSRANLYRAILSEANLGKANLFGANLHEANLAGADLSWAILSETNLTNANLTGCRVYGICAWDLNLGGAIQRDVVITRHDQPRITVDDIEAGQFIYLMLHNRKIRSVMDSFTAKIVLILGCFAPERKPALDALREELRRRDYLPVFFDFAKPVRFDVTETVFMLARMARFVVAFITEAKIIPQELMVIAPNLPSVPIQPLLQAGASEFAICEHLRRYPWVLKEHVYSSPNAIEDIGEWVIGPAEAKARELHGAAPEERRLAPAGESKQTR